MASRGTVGIAHLGLGAAGSYVRGAASVGRAGDPRLRRHLSPTGKECGLTGTPALGTAATTLQPVPLAGMTNPSQSGPWKSPDPSQ